MAPVFRDDAGRLRMRWPFTGLATIGVRPGRVALVLIVLGSTTFDGMTRLDWWRCDVVGARQGWDRTLVHTVGLVFVIGLIALVWQGPRACQRASPATTLWPWPTPTCPRWSPSSSHDRAIERHRSATAATRSPRPLVLAMVLYTIGGLGLLLGA